MVFQIAEEPRRVMEETSHPSGITFLFQPDTILSFQYFELLRRKTYLEGEKKLMSAVLEAAVACFQKHYGARDKKGKQLFHEVQKWLMDEKDDGVFSFKSICELLGINAEYLRRGLVQWREKQTSRHRPRGRKEVKNMMKDPVYVMEVDEKRAAATSRYETKPTISVARAARSPLIKNREST